MHPRTFRRRAFEVYLPLPHTGFVKLAIMMSASRAISALRTPSKSIMVPDIRTSPVVARCRYASGAQASPLNVDSQPKTGVQPSYGPVGVTAALKHTANSRISILIFTTTRLMGLTHRSCAISHALLTRVLARRPCGPRLWWQSRAGTRDGARLDRGWCTRCLLRRSPEGALGGVGEDARVRCEDDRQRGRGPPRIYQCRRDRPGEHSG